MTDGLQQWTSIPEGDDLAALHLGPVGVPTTENVLIYRGCADLIAQRHNEQVQWARTVREAEAVQQAQQRTTIGDVEAMLTRVAVATVRELVRGVRPVQAARWLLRPVTHR